MSTNLNTKYDSQHKKQVKTDILRSELYTKDSK